MQIQGPGRKVVLQLTTNLTYVQLFLSHPCSSPLGNLPTNSVLLRLTSFWPPCASLGPWPMICFALLIIPSPCRIIPPPSTGMEQMSAFVARLPPLRLSGPHKLLGWWPIGTAYIPGYIGVPLPSRVFEVEITNECLHPNRPPRLDVPSSSHTRTHNALSLSHSLSISFCHSRMLMDGSCLCVPGGNRLPGPLAMPIPLILSAGVASAVSCCVLILSVVSHARPLGCMVGLVSSAPMPCAVEGLASMHLPDSPLFWPHEKAARLLFWNNLASLSLPFVQQGGNPLDPTLSVVCRLYTIPLVPYEANPTEPPLLTLALTPAASPSSLGPGEGGVTLSNFLTA